jgi:Adenylate and Guanylate cyclase catalytic domain
MLPKLPIAQTVSNLVKDQSTEHAKLIANFAFHAINAASETLIDLDDPSRGCVEIRVGFHVGPVVSNVGTSVMVHDCPVLEHPILTSPFLQSET